ncbi:MAG: amidohydrolase [Verrucomicrobiales bacterium]|nr:amidohydrolase [Verrucomicrobiales bacterium]
MNIYGLQFDIAWENREENFRRVNERLAAKNVVAGSLIVLPEMFATGFSFDATQAIEDIGGETDAFLSVLAKQTECFVVGGLAVRNPDGTCHNTARVFSPQGILVTSYLKQRPFSLGGELKHFTSGDQPFSFSWNGITVCPMICYDLRFPELFRAAVKRFQPELFVVIASWPVKRIHHWTRLLQARAIENQCYVIGVNRIGKDPNHEYNGHSMIVDFHGETVESASSNDVLIEGKLDIPSLREYRTALPFLNDMR